MLSLSGRTVASIRTPVWSGGPCLPVTTQASSGTSADRGRPAGGLAPCLPSGPRRERPIALNKLDGAEAARAECYAALFQVVEQGNQVAQAAAKPVELPDNQRVAGLQLVQATEQGRALGRCAGQPVIAEDVTASGVPQRRELQGFGRWC